MTTYCQLQMVGDRLKCPTCGRPMLAVADPSKIQRECRSAPHRPAKRVGLGYRVADIPCRFRGPQLRTEGGCCGDPGKAVFACTQFVECTLADHGLRIDGDPSGDFVGVCATCQKRQASIVTAAELDSIVLQGASRRDQAHASFRKTVEDSIEAGREQATQDTPPGEQSTGK